MAHTEYTLYFWNAYRILFSLCTSAATTPLQSDSYLISCIAAVQWLKAVFLMIGLVCWPSIYCPSIYLECLTMVIVLFQLWATVFKPIYWLCIFWKLISLSIKLQLASCVSILKRFCIWLHFLYNVYGGCPGVMCMEGLAYVHQWVYLLTHTVVQCACATLLKERKRLLR